MKNILGPIRSCICLLLLFTILLGGIYPLIVSISAKIFFNSASSGSLIKSGDTISGSRLLGQQFTDNKYFWGRLSANKYDSVNSAGTNLGQTNPKLLEAANARIEALQSADPENKAKIPVELITASASGLDPHISRLAAEYQIGRIAKARGISDVSVQELITEHIDTQSKIFGNPYVNVLELNLALDNLGK